MIPLMRPTLPAYERVENDLRKILTTGMISNGEYVKKFEEKAAKYLGVKHAIACPSASLGLMIVMSTIPEGSEVIMPGYTFSATYQGLLWNNLKAVFVDCDEYCNIDATKVEKAITPKTKAIIGVHMFGNPCDVEALEAIAKKHNIQFFTDAAHAFGSEFKGTKVGGFGTAEIFSLGPTKTMPVGEGCIVSTNSEEFAKEIRLRCNHGQKVHGNMDSSVKSVNGRLEEINAAIGIHLIDDLDSNIERRNKIVQHYYSQLKDVPGIEICMASPKNKSTYKDFAIFINKEKFGADRDELIAELDKQGIQARRYFYPPAHRLEVNKKEYENVHLPVTERKSATTLSLPMYSEMPIEQVNAVVAAIKKFHEERT